MTDTLAYIDSYFQNNLTEPEKRLFEKRCETDNEFADEVAFYIVSRQAIREDLLKQKQEEWTNFNNSVAAVEKVQAPVRKLFVKKILLYAVAACLLLAVVLFYFNDSSPQQLANTYLAEKQRYLQLSTTMDGEKDSLATAIEAYNDHDFDKALSYFQAMRKNDPQQSDYIKYLGFSYLQRKEYDKAIVQFNELAAQDLKNNPGKFLSAITLILRNEKGDRAEAKKIIQQVIDEKLEGHEEAGKLLEKLS